MVVSLTKTGTGWDRIRLGGVGDAHTWHGRGILANNSTKIDGLMDAGTAVLAANVWLEWSVEPIPGG